MANKKQKNRNKVELLDSQGESLIVEVEESFVDNISEVDYADLTFKVPTYKYKVGEQVKVKGLGSSTSDLGGSTIKNLPGARGVEGIVEGAIFPYLIVNVNKRVIGYFKEESIERV